VCRALAVNYKKFSSGAPDLLLIRVSRPRTRDSMGPPECLDLEQILGPSWGILADSEEGEPGGMTADTAKSKDTDSKTKVDHESDDFIGAAPATAQHDEVKAVYKGKGRGFRWRKRKGTENDDLNSLQKSKEEVSEIITDHDVPGKSKRNLFVQNGKAMVEDQPSLEIDSEEDHTNGDDLSFLYQEEAPAPIVNCSSLVDSDATTGPMDIDGKRGETVSLPLMKPSDREHYRFTCKESDLVLPVHPSYVPANAHCEFQMLGSEEGEGASKSADRRCHGGWVFQCLMVEVKGPTDSLADHQLMWLRMLQRSGVTALVGHVKETESVL
jgi:VRR-NUC domain